MLEISDRPTRGYYSISHNNHFKAFIQVMPLKYLPELIVKSTDSKVSCLVRKQKSNVWLNCLVINIPLILPRGNLYSDYKNLFKYIIISLFVFEYTY